MNIILSGGWGYGNIGDDAILSATIFNLKNLYPRATITVLTYDLEEGKIFEDSCVSVEYCSHHYCDFSSSLVRYQPLDSRYSILYKVYLKIVDKLIDLEKSHDFIWRKRTKKVQKLIENSDLFVMCGGGYFNEKWMSKARSSLNELEFAQKKNLVTWVVGPTIGKFFPSFNNKISDVLRKAEFVTVRDIVSQNRLQDMGVKSKIITDIAMTHCTGVEKTKDTNTLGVIITSSNPLFQNIIVDNLKAFIDKNREYSVKLILSRRWKGDFRAVCSIQRKLHATSIYAEIIVPSSLIDAENQISSCKIVVSQNLHGLILAARNGVPVISLNENPIGSPNFIKIEAFLSQVGSTKYNFNSSGSNDELNLLIVELLEKYEAVVTKLEESIEVVKSDYLVTLGELKSI